MSRSTISTFKLFELFPDEPTARKYLEGRLWPNGVTCPQCKSKERITIRKEPKTKAAKRRIRRDKRKGKLKSDSK